MGPRQTKRGGGGAECMPIVSKRVTIREGRGMDEPLMGGWGQECAIGAAFSLKKRHLLGGGLSIGQGKVITQRRKVTHA